MIESSVKCEIEGHLRGGLSRVVSLPDAPRVGTTTNDELLPWLIALYLHRYGVIYWMSRHDAKVAALRVGAASEALDDIGLYLSETQFGNRIWNFAVSSYVYSCHRSRLEADCWVPPKGFQALDDDRVAILHDFPGPNAAFALGTPLFDLHDFAHVTTTLLCADLYGNKFHTGLGQLPRHLVDLVAAPRFKSPDPLQHADGILFSHILTTLFGDLYERCLPDGVIVDCLAEEAAEYLLGTKSLYCTRVDGIARATRPVSVAELAVLAQNKAYEHPASEMEQLVFTRGGADGHDALAEYSTADRLQALAAMDQRRTYHETRNTLKHRAHRGAYRLVVSRLLRGAEITGPERDLAGKVLDHLDYTDYRGGARRNLFSEVTALLGHTERPGSLQDLGLVSRAEVSR